MNNCVPPFRFLLPCMQIYLLALALLWFLLGLDYAEDSFFNGVVLPFIGFMTWGCLQCWVCIVLLKRYFTISRARSRALLWTLPPLFTPIGAAIYYLQQEIDPLLVIPVLIIAAAYTLLLIVWHQIFYLIYRHYYATHPWAM